MEVSSGEIISIGLSMPHSPRWHDGWLWLLESGTGGVVLVDATNGRRETVAQLPGFTRGLAVAGHHAFVGLSKIRPTSAMDGVPLAERRHELRCRIAVLDLRSGQSVGFLEFQSAVEEIFDVQLLPGGCEESQNDKGTQPHACPGRDFSLIHRAPVSPLLGCAVH
jgi:uncharacterized protein (TIGR03032 family)